MIHRLRRHHVIGLLFIIAVLLVTLPIVHVHSQTHPDRLVVAAGDSDGLIRALLQVNAQPTPLDIYLEGGQYAFYAQNEQGEPALPAISGRVRLFGQGAQIHLFGQTASMTAQLVIEPGARVELHRVQFVVVAGMGRAIVNHGDLRVYDSQFGDPIREVLPGQGEGGGIENDGRLRIERTTFTRNQYRSDKIEGGAIYNAGDLTVSCSRFVEGLANQGGAVFNRGTAGISLSAFRGNEANGGGAVFNAQGIVIAASNWWNDSPPAVSDLYRGTDTITSNIVADSPLDDDPTNLAACRPESDAPVQPPVPAAPQTFVVTTIADSGSGSLRQALLDANLTADSDTITFDDTVFAAPQTIVLTDNLPTIVSPLTIDGPDGARVTLDAGNVNGRRVLTITGSFTVDLIDLDMTGGLCNSSCPTSTWPSAGSGLLVQDATVRLTDVNIHDNRAGLYGGGIFNDGGTLTVSASTIENNAAGVNGGGIYNDGSLTMTGNSLVASNTADALGGGIYSYFGTFDAALLTIAHNSVNGHGGGVFSYYNALNMANTTLTGNHAGSNGGGLYGQNGTVAVNDSVLTGNSAAYGGGVYVRSDAAYAFSNCTLTANTALAEGGGIYVYQGNLNLTGSALSDNTATAGGGVYILQGSLNVHRATLDHNLADLGAGLYAGTTGLVTVLDSTLSNGIATENGGGVYALQGELNLTNSTLAGNQAKQGGGLYARIDSNLSITNATVSANQASGTGGGLYIEKYADIELRNSIIAANTAPASPDMFGYLLVNTQNLVGGDPKLGPLQNNGGTTHTMMPALDSMALNQASSLWLTENQIYVDFNGDGDYDDRLTMDQRGEGFPRVMGNYVDIGAVEIAITCPAFPYTVPASDVTSLITAITCANFSPTYDVINLTPSTYTLTSVNNATDGANGLPSIASTQTWGTLTINGNGAIIARASVATPFRIFHVLSDATLTLNNVTLTGGQSDQGGAIFNRGKLTLTRSTLTANAADSRGGSIYNLGTFVTSESTFTQNVAGTDGGALANEGPATVLACTFNDNVAANGNGGGIFNLAGGTVIITSSTLTTNTADLGGGIYNAGAMTATNDTLSANTADVGGGGLYIASGAVKLRNSIVAGNTAPSDSDVFGTPVETFNNLMAGDPKLGPLANNGGPTLTMLPLAGSPVLDEANNLLTVESVAGIDFNGDGDTRDTLTTDQRETGFPRTLGSIVDIGAIEVPASCPALPLTVPAGDTKALIIAVGCANETLADDVIELTNSTYTFMSGNNLGENIHPTGLPAIRSTSGGGKLTIRGNGATLARETTAPSFRLIYLSSQSNLTLDNVTLRGGIAGSYGGAVYANAAVLTIDNSTFSSNTSLKINGGGAVGHYGGTVRITNSTFTGNSARFGGAIMGYTGSLTIADSTITGNSATAAGGGVYSYVTSLRIDRSAIRDNHAVEEGGGIHGSGSYLYLTESEVAGNRSDGIGGGIYQYTVDSKITRSLIVGNSAASDGGGIYFYRATLEVSNTTITGNAANRGGAVFVNPTQSVFILNSTIATNNSTTESDIYRGSAPVTLKNTLVVEDDCAWGVTDGGNNLQYPAASCPTTIPVADPKLGPLGDYGGQTLTFPLLEGSAAVGVGNPVVCAASPVSSVDQRGVARKTMCDIGAYESAFASTPLSIGIFQAGDWWLRNPLGQSGDVGNVWYGGEGWIPVVGDWDGDGKDSPGIFQDGNWWLRSDYGEPFSEQHIWYGGPGWTPVAGDWDGDGKDSPGIYQDGNWWLRQDVGQETLDSQRSVWYGGTGWRPVSGDWDKDGLDSPGIYQDGNWWLREDYGQSFSEQYVWYGGPGWTPIAGDWDSDGKDAPGIFQAGNWWLRSDLGEADPEQYAWYGGTGWTPVAGRWKQ